MSLGTSVEDLVYTYIQPAVDQAFKEHAVEIKAAIDDAVKHYDYSTYINNCLQNDAIEDAVWEHVVKSISKHLNSKLK